ncbi:MAG: hypothetical protein JXQ76_08650 [Campylobacterales bacterium]|nr:hypothetical protein [Campylobacterales bacterium]
MNFIRNSKRDLILLGNQTTTLRIESEMVDIMLSPSLYTLKREYLEIKYQYQAKKLAPSVLDELLDEGDYQFNAFKDELGWVFVAYKTSEIIEVLARCGVDPMQVESVYVAQQSAKMFANPIELDSTTALGLVDEIVTVMPKALYGERRFLSFDESFRPSSGGLSLGVNRGSVVGKKDAIILASLFSVLGTLFFVEGFGYASLKAKQGESVEALLEEYPALQSKYSRESVAQKYTKRDVSERKKREFLKEIASIVRYGGVVESIEIGASSMRAKLKVQNQNSYNSVDKSIKIKQIDTTTIELEAKV